MDIVRLLLRIAILLAIPVGVVLITYMLLHNYLFVAAEPGSTKTVLVEVRAQPFGALCEELAQKGLIKSWRVLDLLARFKGRSTEIKEGEYELSPGMTPREILEKLISGQVHLRKITFDPGISIRDMGAMFEDAGIITKAEFDAATHNPELLQRAGIEAPSFEGYFYPDTYEFSSTNGVKHVLWQMMEKAEDIWKQKGFTELAEANKVHLSRHEILSLASLVQKASNETEEQINVASVFHNRLDNGMKLQSDASVIYGLEDYSGILTEADRNSPHTYNTFVNFGPPPAPICNPGESAITAVLERKETPFLFFAPAPKKGLVFSTTAKDHRDAEQAYQIWVAAQVAGGGDAEEPADGQPSAGEQPPAAQ